MLSRGYFGGLWLTVLVRSGLLIIFALRSFQAIKQEQRHNSLHVNQGQDQAHLEFIDYD